MQVFGDSPFTSSLFTSPFSMFGPVTGYGGENLGGLHTESPGGNNTGLLADLLADSQPVQNAPGRYQSEGGPGIR